MRELALVAGALALLASCGDRIDDDYGRTTPPDEHTCATTCARLAVCMVYLCNVDTNSEDYSGLESFLEDDCTSSCDEDKLADALAEDPDAFDCMFEESCRNYLGYDDCNVDARYSCY